MSITSELEKLTSLRDRGDLSQAEFENAKALMLAEAQAQSTFIEGPTPEDNPEKEKKQRTQFLCAIFGTLAAALSGGSAIIDPSLGTFGILIFWVGLSSYWWTSHAKLKTEHYDATRQSS